MSVTRHRSTWGDRAASGHPATPVDNEGPAIPGTPEDPEMGAYAKGDPSAWAEDPMPGPYSESGHPATPDEGSAWDKAAAMEAKAAKCIVIAMHMLGDPKGDRAKIAAVEAQAMSLLSLPNTHIASTLKRIGAEEEVQVEENEEAKKKAALSVKAEDEVEEDKEVEEAKKKAAVIRARLAGEEPAVEEKETEEAKKKAAFGVEDQTLEAMLAEEGMGAEDQTLEAMLAEEAAPVLTEEAMFEDQVVDEFGFGTDLDDPMGLMETTMSEEEGLLLASLHVQAGDETPEETEEEVEAKKKAARLAAAKSQADANKQARTASAGAPRPQPKTASNGATKLGGPVQRVAASAGDELSALWPTAPDVSKHF